MDNRRNPAGRRRLSGGREIGWSGHHDRFCASLNSPEFYEGSPGESSAVWEPDFSLGQLYNKGLFVLGYYNEVNEFARAILEKRSPTKGTLDQARQVTCIFEAFAGEPGHLRSPSSGFDAESPEGCSQR